jgi:hypothetical protein
MPVLEAVSDAVCSDDRGPILVFVFPSRIPVSDQPLDKFPARTRIESKEAMARRFARAGTSVITGAGLGLLLAMSGLRAGTAKPDSGSAAARGVVRVEDFDAHIYPRPDLFATPLGRAQLNSSYYVLSQTPGWCRVALAQGTGWIPVSHVLLPPAERESYILGVHSRRVFYGALCGSLVGSAVGLVAGWTAINSIFKVDWQVYGPVQGNRGVSATTLELSSCTGLFGLALAPGGAAFGAWSAGEQERPGGSLARAWLMADISWLCFTGIGVGLDAFVSAYATNGNFVPVFTPTGSVLGMALGAAWAYESSQPHGGPPGFLAGHFLPPTVGFCMTGRDRALSHTGLNARLLSLQF